MNLVLFSQILGTFSTIFFPSFFLLCLIQLSLMADKGNPKNKEKNRLHFPFHGLHIKWTWCQLL